MSAYQVLAPGLRTVFPPLRTLDNLQPTVDETLSENIVNPYKGLRAFQEADALDFFGRLSLIDRLLFRLARLDEGQANRFLAVVGPSGSGKSSVVRAGLLPALRRGAVV